MKNGRAFSERRALIRIDGEAGVCSEIDSRFMQIPADTAQSSSTSSPPPR